MKRYLSLLILVPCMLSGCTGNTENTENTGAANTQAVTESMAEAVSEAAGEAVSETAGEAVSEAAPEKASEAVETPAAKPEENAAKAEPAEEKQAAAADESAWEKLMSYKVSDIDKKSMRFGDIVSQNKVTMVNVWGTFCGPCLDEMPDIEALYKQYKGEGFGVVGLTCDIMKDGSIDESVLRDAIDIRRDNGITYPLLIETEELDNEFSSMYVPATFFLDKNGKIIDEDYVGSQSKEDWEKVIKKNLDKVK